MYIAGSIENSNFAFWNFLEFVCVCVCVCVHIFHLSLVEFMDAESMDTVNQL